MNDLESWRPALAAFYRGDGSFQRAANVGRLGLPLDSIDVRTIAAIADAMELAPIHKAKAA